MSWATRIVETWLIKVHDTLKCLPETKITAPRPAPDELETLTR